MTHALTVRAGAPSDYEVVAALFDELGTSDAFHTRERFAAEVVPDLVVAERGGAVVGYVYTQTLTTTGYVRHLATSPGARRTGVGRALLEVARERFVRAGCDAWCLNVKPDNVAARTLYEALGMRARYASSAVRFDWSLVEGLPEPSREPPRGVVTRPCEPADDDVVERSLGLPAGQLGSTRALPGRVLVLAEGLAAPGAPLGVACFNPAFPGMFPFRARELAHARALFEACRPLRDPALPHVQVVVEDDPALASALLARGAELRLEIVHYRGELS